MTDFRLSRRTWVIGSVGLVVALAFAAALMLKLGGERGVLWLSDIGEPLIIFAAAVIVIRAARVLGAAHLGRPWLLIGLGVAAVCVGDVTWTIIELGLGREVPYPGLPDVFYVLFYPLLAAGFYLAIRSYQVLVDLRKPIIEAGVVTLLLCVALYFWFLQPYLFSEGLPFGELVLSTFYPLADLVFALGPALAIALVIAEMGGGRLAWPWWAVVAGAVAFSLGDIGYSYLSARGLYESGSLVDAAWSLAAVAFALGASIAWDLASRDSWR